jgi:hypothetical protein
MILLLVACEGTLSLGDPVTPPKADDTAPVAEDSTEVIPGDSTEDPPGDDTGPNVDYDEPAPDVRVDCRGGGDFDTITAAIAAVPSKTRIGVAPCTYDEAIDFTGKELDIYGLGDAADVVIRAPSSGPVVTAVRGESIATRLAHVTLTGGGGTYGAALYMDAAILTLQDVAITDIGRTTVLIYTSGAGLTLSDVRIGGNDYARGGYVFYVDNGWLNAQWLRMDCDDAQYGVVEHEATLVLDSRITCPDADVAVYVGGGELHMRRSEVVGGEYGIYGEDNNDTRNERMWLFNTAIAADDTAVAATYMHLKARNDVFWGGRVGLYLNDGHIESYVYASAMHGSRCAAQGDGYAYTNSWNAVDDETCGFDMPDAIVGDPMFVDPPNDFHLADGSPLIDAGDPDEDEADDDDSPNDIGRYCGPEADGPR